MMNYTVNSKLKVPKCEIFDLFDFNDFMAWSVYG
jgi:hypothetical protein